MAAEGSRLESLARAVADGLAVDWEQARREAVGNDERWLIQNLESLQSLARATCGRRALPATWRDLALRAPLGRGSFGDVFAAWDAKLQREVALKIVPLDSDAAQVAPLVEEGRLLAQVRHPNVVTVYGVDASQGWAGLWMERVQGRTLASIVRDAGPLALREAMLVGIDVACALAAVHAVGILHCDVKPSNVMREDGGRTVLMDFGIGRRAGTAGPQTAGTPAFMAPEVIGGEPASVRSDVYMLGALLVSLTTGAPPTQSATSRLRAFRDAHPAPFVRVVERALDPDPSRRWASAGEMAEALTTALVTVSPGQRWRRLAAGTALVAALGLLASRAWQPRLDDHHSNPPGVAGATTSVAPSAAPEEARTSSPDGDATQIADGDPFVPPVGWKHPLSDAVGSTVDATLPFSIRARWLPRRHPPEIEIRASVPLSIYVLFEKQPSQCYLVFPVPGRSAQNPVAAETTHRVRLAAPPAPVGRLLVVGSRSPLVDFEAAVERTRVPGGGDTYAAIRLTAKAVEELRRLEPDGAGRGPRRLLFEGASVVAPHPEIVQGPWIRYLPLP